MLISAESSDDPRHGSMLADTPVLGIKSATPTLEQALASSPSHRMTPPKSAAVPEPVSAEAYALAAINALPPMSPESYALEALKTVPAFPAFAEPRPAVSAQAYVVSLPPPQPPAPAPAQAPAPVPTPVAQSATASPPVAATQAPVLTAAAPSSAQPTVASAAAAVTSQSVLQNTLTSSMSAAQLSTMALPNFGAYDAKAPLPARAQEKGDANTGLPISITRHG